MRIRLGIIGTGRIAARFVQEAQQMDDIDVVCVYNPNIQSARRFADEYNIDVYTDAIEEVEELISAVYIASPHETHYYYAKKMLQQGKHILCEKPMTFRKIEAEELFLLAEKMNCVLMEAIKTAYCPGFMAILEAVKSGIIGEVRDVEACFSRLTPTNLREMTDEVYGGSLTEFGSYTFLPIIKLLGTAYKNVEFKSLKAANGVDIYTKSFVEYENAMGLTKTGLAVKSEGQLVIAGTKGYILAESPWWLTKKFEIRFEDPNKREVYNCPYEGSGLQYELEVFVTRILQTKQRKLEQDYIIEATEVITDNGLKPEESIAIASLMEEFLKNRKKEETIPKAKKELKIWAHRGCSMKYPENTLEAFEAAAKIPGITGIELDVQLTKDGEVVVIHDENVCRVTDGTKNVVEYTLEELKQLKIYAGKGKTTTIPTLQEVLMLLESYCKENGLLINIELKTSKIRYLGIEEKTLRLVQEFGLEDYIVYSSFLPESVGLMKKLAPNAKTGMLASSLEACIKYANMENADALHPPIRDLHGSIPEEMIKMPVRVWNGEEPFFEDGRILREKNLMKYAAFGVTDIITNVPELYI